MLASLEMKASIQLDALLYAFWWTCVYILQLKKPFLQEAYPGSKGLGFYQGTQ